MLNLAATVCGHMYMYVCMYYMYKVHSNEQNYKDDTTYILTTAWVMETLFFFLSVTRGTDGPDFATEFLLGIITVFPVQRAAPNHVERKEDGEQKSVEAHSRHDPEEDAGEGKSRMAEAQV